MNKLYESIIRNSFYFEYTNKIMKNQSGDFIEVLEAWANVIGVHLSRDLKVNRRN